MKKNLTWVLILAIIFSLVAAVPVSAAVELEKVKVTGVPTLLVEKEGVQISADTGEKINSVNKDDVVLVGEVDFDAIEEATRDKLLESTILPLLYVYADRDLEDKLIGVDPESAYLIFDFFFKESGRKFLDKEDGIQANLHFELTEEISYDDLVIAQYVDNEWVILDTKFYLLENGYLTLNLENEGMLAFFRLKKVRDYLVEEGNEREEVDVPGTEEEHPYRPSVGRKGYPEIIYTEGYHYILESTTLKFIQPGVEIPLGDVKIRSAKEFTGEDKEAYDELEEAAENGRLSDVCKNLLDILKKNFDNLPENKLVVSDVFKIELSTFAKSFLDGEDTCVEMTFRYSIDSGDTFIVLQYIDGEWVALDPMWVKVNNENVTVTLLQDGIVAFVVEGE